MKALTRNLLVGWLLAAIWAPVALVVVIAVVVLI